MPRPWLGSMAKKEIQRQRMMRYMIDAAKTIIEQEGADEITVRKVSDIAGYSYATLYNYFADLNELLWYVAADYLDEMIQVITLAEKKSRGKPTLLNDVYRDYVSFYLNKPSVYRFAFFQQLGDPPAEVAEKFSIPILGEKQIAALTILAEQGRIDKTEINQLGELLTGYTHGLLLFYFSNRMQLNQKELLSKLNATINYILDMGPEQGGS